MTEACNLLSKSIPWLGFREADLFPGQPLPHGEAVHPAMGWALGRMDRSFG
jgi:hypothetical protein